MNLLQEPDQACLQAAECVKRGRGGVTWPDRVALPASCRWVDGWQCSEALTSWSPAKLAPTHSPALFHPTHCSSDTEADLVTLNGCKGLATSAGFLSLLLYVHWLKISLKTKKNKKSSFLKLSIYRTGHGKGFVFAEVCSIFHAALYESCNTIWRVAQILTRSSSPTQWRRRRGGLQQGARPMSSSRCLLKCSPLWSKKKKRLECKIIKNRLASKAVFIKWRWQTGNGCRGKHLEPR